MEFLRQLKEKAQQNRKKIVFPESKDMRILKAAHKIQEEKIAFPLLIGDEQELSFLAKTEGFSLQGIDIIFPEKSPHFKEYTALFYEMRKHKGMTEEQAKIQMKDPIYFGAMIVHTGEAYGMISGSLTPTSDTLRAAFQIIGVQEGIKKASSTFLMVKEDEGKIFFFADNAVNIDPTSEDLADIAIATAATAQSFGIEPRIALLSFSTYGSAVHPFVDKVRQAREIVEQKRPDLIVGGEMQLDAALVPEVAKLKCPQSPIQGDANVFIFPDLQAGNIGYKIAQRLGKFQAIGPIIQGVKKPVNDLSRGCSVQDIVDMAIITANQ